MTTWTTQAKNTATFTPEAKHTGSFTAQTKNTATFTPETKHSAIWDNGIGHLLLELTTFLLQENGGKIVLEESWGFIRPITWSMQLKS